MSDRYDKELLGKVLDLTPAAQFHFATLVAENVGYVLEPVHRNRGMSDQYRNEAFGIVTKHGDCLLDDYPLDGLIDDIASALKEKGGAISQQYAEELGRQIDELESALKEKEEECAVWKERAEKTFDTLQEVSRVTGTQVLAAESSLSRMKEALEIIAGNRQCLDNLMSNQDVARSALSTVKDFGEPQREDKEQ